MSPLAKKTKKQKLEGNSYTITLPAEAFFCLLDFGLLRFRKTAQIE